MNFKEYYNFVQYIVEGTGFTLQDLKQQVPSDRNKHFLKDREENGTPGSFLTDVDWNEKKDYLTLFFDVNPTYEKQVKIISPKGKFNTSNNYLVRLQVEDINKHLGSIKDFMGLKPKEQIDLLKLMIKTATFKVGSDDMSWIYQGTWDVADKLGYAIDKFPKGIPRGKGIWSKKHKGEYPAIYATKHILEACKVIPFIVDKISKLIREKYK